MILELKHLLLEVTRQCNMACRHCMRGDAENLSMSDTIIDRIFRDTRKIGHLCLTGGEPSLAPRVIMEILYRARRWGCSIGSFFCATNAKTDSPQFAHALTRLYEFCTAPKRCTLTVTTDQFHEAADPEAMNRYCNLLFYRPVYEYGQIPAYSILEEGRAKENGLGRSELPIKSCIYDADYTGFSYKIGDTVYINAKGGVILNADLSYKNQEEFCIGNVMEDNLPHILATVFYLPRFSYGTQVYRVCLRADADTIDTVRIEDERYYGRESAAMGVFHRTLHNLRITPIKDCNEAPDTLKLSVKPKGKDELVDNRLAETTVTYTDGVKKLGAVRIYVECFPLEDACHE